MNGAATRAWRAIRRVALGALCFAVPAAAQAAAADTAVVQPPRPLETESAGGLHIGYPAIISIAFGPARELSYKRDRNMLEVKSLFTLVEPGVNAGRLSLGYSYSLNGLMITAAARATALRIWRGGSVGNYVGVEASMMTFAMQARIGIFHPVSPHATGLALITADLGLGL